MREREGSQAALSESKWRKMPDLEGERLFYPSLFQKAKAIENPNTSTKENISVQGPGLVERELRASESCKVRNEG